MVCVLLSTNVPIELAFATLARACQIIHNTHQSEACQGENGKQGASGAGKDKPLRVHIIPEQRVPELKHPREKPYQAMRYYVFASAGYIA
jgi:hypothetical protein